MVQQPPPDPIQQPFGDINALPDVRPFFLSFFFF